jgi:hypothetical protein
MGSDPPGKNAKHCGAHLESPDIQRLRANGVLLVKINSIYGIFRLFKVTSKISKNHFFPKCNTNSQNI